jgi:hypothetical protein
MLAYVNMAFLRLKSDQVSKKLVSFIAGLQENECVVSLRPMKMYLLLKCWSPSVLFEE